MNRGRIDDGGDRGGAPRLDGEADGRAVLAVDDDVREGGDAADLDAHRREEPREMATAFTAWFTAPAPTA